MTLSVRETEVLELLAEGMRTQGISNHLGTTESTVKTQIRSVLVKLRAKTRAEAVAIAIRDGLIR